MRLLRRAFLPGPVTVPVAGCGQGVSDRQRVLNVVRDSIKAMDRGDRSAMCRPLAPSAQAAVVEDLRRLQTDPAFQDSCSTALGAPARVPAR